MHPMSYMQVKWRAVFDLHVMDGRSPYRGAYSTKHDTYMQGAAHTTDAGLRNVTGLQPLCPAAGPEYKSQRKLRATTCLPWNKMVIYIATIQMFKALLTQKLGT